MCIVRVRTMHTYLWGCVPLPHRWPVRRSGEELGVSSVQGAPASAEQSIRHRQTCLDQSYFSSCNCVPWETPSHFSCVFPLSVMSLSSSIRASRILFLDLGHFSEVFPMSFRFQQCSSCTIFIRYIWTTFCSYLSPQLWIKEILQWCWRLSSFLLMETF